MNIVLLIGTIIGVFFAGSGIGWFVASVKQKAKDQQLIDAQAQKQAAEQMLVQVQEQYTQKDLLIKELQERISSEQQEKTVAQTKLEESVKNLEQQKQLLEKTEEKLSDTFKALSGEALKSNNKAFIELAQESLGVVLSKAKGDIGKKEDSIKNVVQSLGDSLKRYEEQMSHLEKKRAGDYGSLENQIKTMVNASQQLQKETGNLVTALRRPEVRGRWGEVTLKRVVELAGMSEHCDFTEQVSVTTDTGRIRPDMIVNLPAGREIVVDSKVSLDAYMEAVNAEDEKVRKEMIVRHSQQVRRHMKQLAAKNYWEQFENAPEFVVMFIPGESFLSAALEVDHAIIEDGMKDCVIIATPTTIIALLRAIAFGWRQEQVAKNAQEIATLGKEIYERFHPFLQHVNKTSDYFSGAISSFNKMIMSLERRVMVSVRKFKELGASGDKDLPLPKIVEQSPMKTQGREELEEEVEVEKEDEKEVEVKV